MRITKTSKLTGIIHTLEIDVTDRMIERWKGGVYIQAVMPHLSADEREFLMTGITADEWANAFARFEHHGEDAS